MNTNCTACGSPNLRTFDAEVNIHFQGLRGIDMASVFVFPRFLICLDCGQMESTLSKSDLQLLKEDSGSFSGNRSNSTAA
jgi:hypothetical protein